jgi:hypothetical protein
MNRRGTVLGLAATIMERGGLNQQFAEIFLDKRTGEGFFKNIILHGE